MPSNKGLAIPQRLCITPFTGVSVSPRRQSGEAVLGDLVNAVAAIGMLLHHETEHAKKKCDRIIDQEAARLAPRKEKNPSQGI